MYNKKILAFMIIAVVLVMGFTVNMMTVLSFNRISENIKEEPTAYIDTARRLDDYMVTAIIDNTTVTALNIIDGKRYTVTVASTYQNKSAYYIFKKPKPDNADIIITAATLLDDSTSETNSKQSSCSCNCCNSDQA